MSLVDVVAPRMSGWCLSVCPAAREAGGSFRYALSRSSWGDGGQAPDPERAAIEAARRARGKVRRYCAGNLLNRLGTLTFAGEGCHDPIELRALLGRFFRSLREATGGDPFPYLWVTEWHKTGHGLHVHVAVGQFIKRSLIDQAWGHGFIHIKLLGDLPVGSGPIDQARGRRWLHVEVRGQGVRRGSHPWAAPLRGGTRVPASDRLGVGPHCRGGHRRCVEADGLRPHGAVVVRRHGGLGAPSPPRCGSSGQADPRGASCLRHRLLCPPWGAGQGHRCPGGGQGGDPVVGRGGPPPSEAGAGVPPVRDARRDRPGSGPTIARRSCRD